MPEQRPTFTEYLGPDNVKHIRDVVDELLDSDEGGFIIVFSKRTGDTLMPTKDSAELRNELFASKSLKTNLRDIVAQACTGHNYSELCEIVADPNNDEMLDLSEVDEVNKTVTLLAHLYIAHTAAQVAAARVEEVERLVDVGGENIQVRAWAAKYRDTRLTHLTTGQKDVS